MGIAFVNEHSAWVSEGNSGKIALFDWNSSVQSGRRRTIDLNQKGYDDSYTGDLALDSRARHALRRRPGEFPGRGHRHPLAAGDRVGEGRAGCRLRMTLSPDRRKAIRDESRHVRISGDSRRRSRSRPSATGLPFPPSGFRARSRGRGGARHRTGAGQGAGPGRPECSANPTRSASWMCPLPAAPKVESLHPDGSAVRPDPSTAAAARRAYWPRRARVFVSNANDDTITVIDAEDQPRWKPRSRSASRAWKRYRGVLPIGLAYHEKSGWLLVAEAGINAVGVIDVQAAARAGPRSGGLVSHTRGAGPRHGVRGQRARLRAGSERRRAGRCGRDRSPCSRCPRPANSTRQTAFVMEANGFRASAAGGAAAAGRHQARGADRQGESHVRRGLRRYSGRDGHAGDRALRNARVRGRQAGAAEHPRHQRHAQPPRHGRASGPSATTSTPIATSAWTGITGWWARIPTRGPKAR